nr:hypothetical protein [Candidatus Magnetaquicoccus inordinatus]
MEEADIPHHAQVSMAAQVAVALGHRQARKLVASVILRQPLQAKAITVVPEEPLCVVVVAVVAVQEKTVFPVHAAGMVAMEQATPLQALPSFMLVVVAADLPLENKMAMDKVVAVMVAGRLVTAIPTQEEVVVVVERRQAAMQGVLEDLG